MARSMTESSDSDDDIDDDDIIALQRYNTVRSPESASAEAARPLTREGVKIKSMESLKRSLKERARQRKTRHRLNQQ